MWQRFTERARKVVFYAQEEANQLGQKSYVATEHILLGLTRDNDHVAARMLAAMNVSLESIRAEVERILRTEQSTPLRQKQSADMMLTPRAKRVIDLSYDEARLLSHNYIGTEHLLLGLIREGEGIAGRALATLEVTLDKAHLELLRLAAASRPASEEKEPATSPGQTIEGLRLKLFQALAEAQEQVSGLGQSKPETEVASNPARPGDLGVLRSLGENNQAAVAVDEEAYRALAEIIAVKDDFGYREMASAGRLFVVSTLDDLSVKLLQVGASGGYRIRLLEGEQAGKVGWIAPEQFAHIGPDSRPFPPPLPVRPL